MFNSVVAVDENIEELKLYFHKKGCSIINITDSKSAKLAIDNLDSLAQSSKPPLTKKFFISDVSKTGDQENNFAEMLRKTPFNLMLVSSVSLTSKFYKKDLLKTLVMIEALNKAFEEGRKSKGHQFTKRTMDIKKVREIVNANPAFYDEPF